MYRKLIFILCAFTLSLTTAMGQGLGDVRINEILVKNTNSYEDDFGHKVGWIELFNSGYASANPSGARLRLISGKDTTTYSIPANDSRTLIAPQGYIIFFADGSDNKGTFYTNFTLDKGKGDITLQLVDQSGKKVIDEITYNVKEQEDNISYGRKLIINEDGTDDGEYKYAKLDHITPLQTNDTVERKKKSEEFQEEDPGGGQMAVIAMSVVFSALIMLFLAFHFLGKAMKAQAKNKAKKAATVSGKSPAVSVKKVDGLTGEMIAAIAVAINMFEEELHDIESNVVTINKVARAYSPWSSKIYSLRQTPNKKTW